MEYADSSSIIENTIIEIRLVLNSMTGNKKIKTKHAISNNSVENDLLFNLELILSSMLSHIFESLQY
jgi:hypothetical protein